MTSKDDLRKTASLLRKALPPHRRDEARSALSRKDWPLGLVLSFASFGSEIDTSFLNQKLADHHQLCLPYLEKDSLAIYHIQDLTRELELSPRGFLQPNPFLCPKIPLSEITCALIPGLLFDSRCFRLGYGKGCYDRLLDKLSCPSIGLGFKEQSTPLHLDFDPWDRALGSVEFF